MKVVESKPKGVNRVRERVFLNDQLGTVSSKRECC